MKRQVLITRVDNAAFERAAKFLHKCDVDLHFAQWDDNTLGLVQRSGFDVILVGFPVAAASLRRFVRCVRAPGSACRRCGLILIAEPGYLEQAQAFVGHGVNRAIAWEHAPHLLAHSVDELVAVAPRLTLRAPARIMIHLDERPIRAFCQTENVSLTGMLLRGFGHYPPGTTIDFEINIPGEGSPICGTAQIARSTNIATERVEGVGARFVGFSDADQLRLATYLDDQLN